MAALLGAGLLLAGCPSEPQTHRSDAAGALPSSRADSSDSLRPLATVVSLDPMASRFLLALGAEGQIVGVDAASSALPGLEHVPVFADGHASPPDLVLVSASRQPDLVLVSASRQPDDQLRAAFEAGGARIVAFEPHDLEEVTALIRDVGGELVGQVRAMRFETELSRPLAEIGGASFGRPRPRTLAVVGFDPFEVAGGHSFETDLIEIAGGHSVTHPGEESRLFLEPNLDPNRDRKLEPNLEPNAWSAFAPDLVIVMTPDALTDAERTDLRRRLPQDVAVDFFVFEGPGFWLEEPARSARRLFDLIELHVAATASQ